MKYVVVGTENLWYINHSSFRMLWFMVKWRDSTIHYKYKNCYFFRHFQKNKLELAAA